VSVSADLVKLFYEMWDGTEAGRDYLVSNEPVESADKLPRTNSRDVLETMDAFNRIGHLIAQGVLDGGFVTSLVGKEIIRVGSRLEPLLTEARNKRSDPQHQEYVTSLLELSRQAHPGYQPSYEVHGRRPVGLTG
jgi:hypothetical protein